MWRAVVSHASSSSSRQTSNPPRHALNRAAATTITTSMSRLQPMVPLTRSCRITASFSSIPREVDSRQWRKGGEPAKLWDFMQKRHVSCHRSMPARRLWGPASLCASSGISPSLPMSTISGKQVRSITHRSRGRKRGRVSSFNTTLNPPLGRNIVLEPRTHLVQSLTYSPPPDSVATSTTTFPPVLLTKTCNRTAVYSLQMMRGYRSTRYGLYASSHSFFSSKTPESPPPSTEGSKNVPSQNSNNFNSSTENNSSINANGNGNNNSASNNNDNGSTGKATLAQAAQKATQRTLARWNPSDFLTLVLAMSLLSGIVLGPKVINLMRQSNETYEDLLDDDDVITNLTKIINDYSTRLHNHNDASQPHDSVLVQSLSDVVRQVLVHPQVQSSLQQLALNILQAPEFVKAVKELVKVLFDDLIQDPETLVKVVGLLQKVIEEEQVKQALIKLLLEIVEEEEVHQALTAMVIRVGAEKEVLEATQALLTESAHQTLTDPEILDHSMEFAADVVGDDVVQRTGGEALWNTIQYSVRPAFTTMLYVTGVSLVAFAFAAWGKSKSYGSTSSSSPSSSSLTRNVPLSTSNTAKWDFLDLSWLLRLPSTLLASVAESWMKLTSLPNSVLHRVSSSLSYWVQSFVMHPLEYLASLPSQWVDSLSLRVNTFSSAMGENISSVWCRMSTSAVGTILSYCVSYTTRAVQAGAAGVMVAQRCVRAVILGVMNAGQTVGIVLYRSNAAVVRQSALLVNCLRQNLVDVRLWCSFKWGNVTMIVGPWLSRCGAAVGQWSTGSAKALQRCWMDVQQGWFVLGENVIFVGDVTRYKLAALISWFSAQVVSKSNGNDST